MMTTSDRFPVVDVTHKPLRTQAGNIECALAQVDRVCDVQTGPSRSHVPSVITVERAIEFYEEEADRGNEYSSLYNATAKWLRDYLSIRKPKKDTVTEEVTTDEEQPGSEV